MPNNSTMQKPKGRGMDTGVARRFTFRPPIPLSMGGSSGNEACLNLDDKARRFIFRPPIPLDLDCSRGMDVAGRGEGPERVYETETDRIIAEIERISGAKVTPLRLTPKKSDGMVSTSGQSTSSPKAVGRPKKRSQPKSSKDTLPAVSKSKEPRLHRKKSKENGTNSNQRGNEASTNPESESSVTPTKGSKEDHVKPKKK
ncbi:hypothetical protein KR200_000606 [Drosophila serrata]|nr:hypothetical protein KR200_000606 [Drosophila serrata]